MLFHMFYNCALEVNVICDTCVFVGLFVLFEFQFYD